MKKQQTPARDAWNAVTTGAVDIIEREHLRRRIEKGDRLRVKLGLDPTRPDIHLGHTVPLRALRRYQEHGHQAVLIIGDWTARIGDPSGQNVTRPQLTKEEVAAAAKTYLEQAWKILDQAETEVRFQTEWFDPMRLEDVVELTSRYTVARMLERDDFARRMKESRPVSLHETLYPLLQAYDSVAVRSDLELGGTDQTFNLLVGRDIQEAYGQPPQDIQTMPLLEGLDGVQKMSKSLDNYIGIDEPPEVIYGKAMSIPDSLILRYFRLVTDVPADDIREMDNGMEGGQNPRDVKMRLADAIVRQFHGADAARRAAEHFRTSFQERSQPAFSQEVEVSADAIPVSSLFFIANLVSSKSEARRLAAQKGLYINDIPVSDPEQRVIPENGWRLRRGTQRVAQLRVNKR
jgi:tyrosyl-tRNA synthetase